MRQLIEGLTGTYLANLIFLAQRAAIIMFVAAVVAKRTSVFAPIGYIESLAWAAGYGLLRDLFHQQEKTG